MRRKPDWRPAAGVRISSVECTPLEWRISATLVQRHGHCPGCHRRSLSRHGTYIRTLSDLPVHGKSVRVFLSVPRWRCRTAVCRHTSFSCVAQAVAERFSRLTKRLRDLGRLAAFTAGGRPAQRLLDRLGVVISYKALLRHLVRPDRSKSKVSPCRVIGIDDWSWRRQHSYGTILVDLERRTVLDILPDRSSASTAAWLKLHPTVEIVARDRCGLYAQGIRDGAPQAEQVADRYHILDNLHEAIEKDLGTAGFSTGITTLKPAPVMLSGSEREQRAAAAALSAKLATYSVFQMFKGDQVRGLTIREAASRAGIGLARATQWAALDAPPERRRKNGLIWENHKVRRRIDELLRSVNRRGILPPYRRPTLTPLYRA